MKSIYNIVTCSQIVDYEQAKKLKERWSEILCHKYQISILSDMILHRTQYAVKIEAISDDDLITALKIQLLDSYVATIGDVIVQIKKLEETNANIN